jgi:hypothetical protein
VVDIVERSSRQSELNAIVMLILATLMMGAIVECSSACRRREGIRVRSRAERMD